ncbi:hypothetical protein WG908_02560 [Sphingobium sp. AN641]|uniref:hypothetical protein n=1 Tax=Sphingobium sp. AN641 TaxID=3133443 RepID=UPI0030BD9E88
MPRQIDRKAKSLQEYGDAAGVDEGTSGISTRLPFKAPSASLSHDTTETGADPVRLMHVPEGMVRQEPFPTGTEAPCLKVIKGERASR